MQQQQPEAPKEEPKSLSPIHFRSVAKDQEELDAYSAAYHHFLKYYNRDSTKEEAFGKMLYNALYKRDSALLKIWYHGYRMLTNHKMSRTKFS